MRLMNIVAALAIVAWTLPAAAQAPAGTPTRIRGVIEAVAGQSMTVKTREGDEVKLTLAPDVRVGTNTKASLTDIKEGDFVGAASMKGRDGKYRALEVHIFPESLRGTGEGNRPWDQGPDSAMINATVGQVVGRPSGKVLAVKYKGGEAEIEVSPTTPIVMMVPGDASMLQPGKAVFVGALKQDDGTVVARFVQVETNGVKPPM